MNINELYYMASNVKLWNGRIDSEKNERYFQLIKIINLISDKISDKYNTAILGYCSDEGIKRNYGRGGASKGPNIIRRELANFCIHKTQSQPILDLGNITCNNGNLEYSQKILSNIVANILKRNIKTLLLGGGHEISLAHYNGINKAYKSKNIGIINFDSHFDLRKPVKPGYGTSGTSFYQIYTNTKKYKQKFNYLVIGIQRAANSKKLFTTAKQLKINILFAEDINNTNKNQKKYIDLFLQNIDIIYVTCCLDVFNSSIAPGVSSPQITGIFTNQAIPILQHIFNTNKVVAMDIAELSPILDINNNTSKLAARLAWEFLEHNQ